MTDGDDLDLHEAAKAHYAIYTALKAEGFDVDDLEVHLTLLAKCYGFVASGVPPELRPALFKQITDVGGEMASRINEPYGFPPKAPTPN
jgi:hypothetical protein